MRGRLVEGTNGWEDWIYKETKRGGDSWESRHLESGLACMIHKSGYKSGFTSTTFWIIGQRGIPGDHKSDRYLRSEKFTNPQDAVRWIESKNPWDIYQNECKLPDRVESYNDPDEPPPPKKKQKSFF